MRGKLQRPTIFYRDYANKAGAVVLPVDNHTLRENASGFAVVFLLSLIHI